MEHTIDFEKEARERIERIRQAGGAVDNPSVTAAPCHLPLHKGGAGAAAPEQSGADVKQGNGAGREGQDPAAQEMGGKNEPAEEQLQMPPAMTPRNMSREEWHNMERAAAKGLMPDETVTPTRRMLYFTMVGLYAAVAAGVMPAGVAKAEKRMAIEAYDRMCADAAIFRGTGEFYKKVEQATTAYGKRACFDNAEAMYKAVLRAMPKKEHREDDWDDAGTKSTGRHDAASQADQRTDTG